MRKIIATARVSLDGVMQGPVAAQEDTSDGFDLGGWITQFRDPKGGAAVLSLVGTLDKPYDLLLGRKTFDIFVRHWPNVPVDDPIGPVFTKTNKYVLTRGMANSTGPTAIKLGGIEELKKVKAEEGPDIVLWEARRSIRNCLMRISSTEFYCSPARLFLEKGKSSSVASRTP
jgi:dihydrofolate reductase